MHEVSEFFARLFSPDSWPARWHCGNWTSFHGWLYIISSLLIAAAYFSIPVALFLLIRKGKNKIPFKNIFWLFVLFIFACGTTHMLDALMFWIPIYRVSAIFLFITAVISWAAVVATFKVLPQALALKSPMELERIISERTAELSRLNEDLKRSNGELKEAQRVSNELLHQKEEFINVASHEMKTPLTTLKIYAHLLDDETAIPASEKKGIVGKIGEQVDKLTHLVNDMLDSSRIEGGRLLYREETFMMKELINSVAEEMQGTVGGHNIVTGDMPNEEVYADRERIKQVLQNLISNAAKFSDKGTDINIRLTRNNDVLICSVTDAGKGIAAHEHDKIFERFYRAGEGNRNTYPGMGLGLYIAREIIDRHHGKMWVESEPGKGATFFFSLPSQQRKSAEGSFLP